MINTQADADALRGIGDAVSRAMGVEFARVMGANLNDPFVRDNFLTGALAAPQPETQDNV